MTNPQPKILLLLIAPEPAVAATVRKAFDQSDIPFDVVMCDNLAAAQRALAERSI